MSQNNDIVTLIPGAILVITTDLPLEGAMIDVPDKQILNSLSYSVLVDDGYGGFMSFKLNEKYDLTTLTTYEEGQDVMTFLRQLEADKYGKVMTQDTYDDIYASSPNFLEIPVNFHSYEIGVEDAAEKEMFDRDPTLTITDQIKTFRETYEEILKGNTEWGSSTYREAWLKNWMKYQDYQLAKLATEGDITTMNQVYKDIGMTAEMVQASNYYKMNEGAYKRDFGANLSFINDIETEFTGELDTASKEWVANKVTMGEWSKEFARSQIYKALDSYREGELHPDFKKILEGKDISETTKGQSEIRALIDKWIPENYKSTYLEKINEYAGKYRADPRYLDELQEELKTFKATLLPQYDRDTDMTVIDALTKQTIFNKWQMQVNPDGDYGYIYDKVQSLNDVNEANKFLIQEGMNNNIQGVMVPFAEDLLKSFGGNIVKTQDFIEPTTRRRGIA